MLILALILVLALSTALISALNASASSRSRITIDALAQAKKALMAYAVTYRDMHTDDSFGYLPCPDTDGDGKSDSCGLKNVSLLGRLPWKTLGIPPLRDETGECLWYAVSGHVKDNPQTSVFNWDTPGQLVLQDLAGKILAGASPHDRPLAVVIAPRSPLNGQARSPSATSECNGPNSAEAFLESLDSHWSESSYVDNLAVSVASPTTQAAPGSNDITTSITSAELFERVRKRTDFRAEIDGLLDMLANYLNNQPPAGIPSASVDNKGVTSVIDAFVESPRYNFGTSKFQKVLLNNWRDNLLYAGGKAGNFFVNGSSTPCRAILFFGGLRDHSVPQQRATLAEIADPKMYLEDANAVIFPLDGTYVGATAYDDKQPTRDIVRCINGLGSGQAAFDPASISNDFAIIGDGIATDTQTVPEEPALVLSAVAGKGGGCLWHKSPIPLADKTLRVYYEFRFSRGDGFALGTASTDLGNGFALQLVQGDSGVPDACGSVADMGTLNAMSEWGALSLIFETDVHRDSSKTDPPANHSAILTNGYLNHASASISSSCNDLKPGCRFTPANTFEELSLPKTHNQRIEIVTGCDSNCSTCNPSAHPKSSNYAKVSAWIDCHDCTDTGANLDQTSQLPTIQRCVAFHEEMNSIYFGFTAGFPLNSTEQPELNQGVIINRFVLRSE